VAETFGRLRARVATEPTTTFASNYTREVPLAGLLNPDAFNEYVKRATGEKFLVAPHPNSTCGPPPSAMARFAPERVTGFEPVYTALQAAA
jgi:hypothetical protein